MRKPPSSPRSSPPQPENKESTRSAFLPKAITPRCSNGTGEMFCFHFCSRNTGMLRQEKCPNRTHPIEMSPIGPIPAALKIWSYFKDARTGAKTLVFALPSIFDKTKKRGIEYLFVLRQRPRSPTQNKQTTHALIRVCVVSLILIA